MKNTVLVVFVLILAFFVFLFVSNKYKESKVTSFQTCVKEGYPVQESFPEKCVTPSGKSYKNPDQKVVMDINVYFSKSNDNPEDVKTVVRSSDRIDIGTYALEQLIAGPSSEEKTQSMFTPLVFSGDSNCNNKDFSLNIVDKKATLKFCKSIKDSGVMSDARIISVVNKTLKQFNTISSVVILDKSGNCFGDLSGLNKCLK